MGTGSSVPKKRSLAELFNDSFRLPTPDEQALFDGAAEVEFSQDPLTRNEGEKMAYTSMEAVDRDLILGKLFLVPTMAPNGPFDLEFMSETSWAVFLAEADLTSSGGGFMVKFMGSSDESSTVFRGQRGIKLMDVPTQFIVAKSTPNGIRTALETSMLEVMAQQVLLDGTASAASVAGNTAATGTAPSTTGALGATGGVIKKLAMTSTVDFNGREVILTSKEGAEKRITQLAGPRREMTDERFARVFPQWVCDIEQLRELCLDSCDRGMAAGDPLDSMARLRAIMDLPVWKEVNKFTKALLGITRSSDWSVSLWDFKDRDQGWTFDTDWHGQRNLLRAFENFVDFQRIIKGDAFQGCANPLRELWESQTQVVNKYHAVYIQFHLETLIRAYFKEVSLTRGTKCYASHQLPLGGQGESVALLKHLISEFIADMQSGAKWETAPHTRFYSSRERFASIINKPSYPNTLNAVASSNPPTPVKAQTITRKHHDGLCFWYLAGELGLSDKNAVPYSCKDKTFSHKPLNTVPYNVAQKLLKDPSFLSDCTSLGIRQRVTDALPKKKSLFK
jgi:hypothetical protein